MGAMQQVSSSSLLYCFSVKRRRSPTIIPSLEVGGVGEGGITKIGAIALNQKVENACWRTVYFSNLSLKQ
ncbi:hypothetical protein [Geitlerinema calcuttense]|uniref:Uncharacterized protein n=1 Tax=Geitlerinema calcuttense NRMC-F 0142 TaxID=2922238 RepID=A0ABT7M0A3_9CYAN|nr:hypothetical protein [Geitlerinema calcuttense]MDL5057683.1 hypothetical protein [Geitlerinema calcuttense NRMC-F 0142]